MGALLITAQLPSIFVQRSEGPGAVETTRIELPQIPLPQHSAAELDAAQTRGVTKKVAGYSGWLGYMSSKFAGCLACGEHDRERTLEALGALSLAELRTYKRALVADHPRAWELTRHEVLKDTITGDRKQAQIDKIMQLLEGKVFADAPPNRADLTRFELHLRSGEAQLHASPLTLGALNSIAALSQLLESRLPSIEAQTKDDPAASRRLALMRTRFERIQAACAPLEAAVEREMTLIRARIKEGTWGKADLLRIDSDDREAFVERLLRTYKGETSGIEGDNMGYGGSPVAPILDAIDGMKLGKGDVFFDMGAGLGKVVLLATILTGCEARAVEYHPESCDQLRRVAAELGLSDRLHVIEGDASTADLSKGTSFYFFNPFKGAVMKAVSNNILETAKLHPVQIASFGPTDLSAFRSWPRVGDRAAEILRSP